MDLLFPILFLFPLAAAAYQDQKSRMVSDYLVIAMWLIAYASGYEHLSLMLLFFPLFWFLGDVSKLLGYEVLAWGDILMLPPFLMFAHFFLSEIDIAAFAFPVMSVSLMSLFVMDKGFKRPMFVDAFLIYLMWLILFLFL